MTTRYSRTSQAFLAIFAFLLIFIAVLFLSDTLSESERVAEIVGTLGYLGVVILAIIAGLNSFVPVPAASFTPVFLAAGLTMPFIILSLTIGTLIADFIGFFFGHVSKRVVTEKYPQVFGFFRNLKEKHERLIIPAVALWAAFMPLPNEIILIPLGLLGVHYRTLILPLIVGNILHQLILVYGVLTLVALLFPGS